MSDFAPSALVHPGRFATVRMLARGWWLLALRGGLAIAFGLLAFLLPAPALAVILGVLAAWMLLDGVATISQAVGGARPAVPGAPAPSNGWLWFDGILSLVTAAALLLAPGLSALTLVFVVAGWSVATGVLRLILAFRTGNVLLGLAGAVAALVGAWMFVAPGPGLLAILWLVGLQALVVGALLLGLGWRLRRIHQDPHGPAMGRG